MNQRLTLPFYDKFFVICGGSYYNAPKDHYEVIIGYPHFDCDINIKDVYDPYEVTDAIKRLIVQLYKGKKVFIGCSSGIHGSGVFITMLVAVMLQINPTFHQAFNGDAAQYVKENYDNVTMFDDVEYLTHTEYSYCSSVIHFLNTYPLLRFLPEPVILWLFR